MITSLEKPEHFNDAKDGWPSTVDLKVIVPGLCFYEDLKNSDGEVTGGTVLIRKEAFDKMSNSIKGKPIINWDHRKVNPKEFTQGKFQGVITSEARFNAADGWYHAEGLVWDKATLNNIKNGFSISCAYVPTEVDTQAGRHNMVPYQMEVLNGEYTHIAVVAQPRYEGARIELLNSRGGAMFNLFKKDKTEEKIEIDLDKTTVKMGDKDVTVAELVNSFKQAEELVEKLNRASALKDDDMIEVNGKKVSVLELKNTHTARLNAKEKEDMENSHKAGEHKNRMDNCAMCNSAAEEEDKEKKKEKDEKENSLKAEEAKKAEELKNAAKAKDEEEKKEAAKRGQELENARQKKHNSVEMPKITTLNDLVGEGEARYGIPAGTAK